MIESESVASYVNSPLLRCVEEHRYESRLATVVESLSIADLDAKSLPLRFVCFGRPLGSFFDWTISGFEKVLPVRVPYAQFVSRDTFR